MDKQDREVYDAMERKYPKILKEVDAIVRGSVQLPLEQTIPRIRELIPKGFGDDDVESIVVCLNILQGMFFDDFDSVIDVYVSKEEREDLTRKQLLMKATDGLKSFLSGIVLVYQGKTSRMVSSSIVKIALTIQAFDKQIEYLLDHDSVATYLRARFPIPFVEEYMGEFEHQEGIGCWEEFFHGRYRYDELCRDALLYQNGMKEADKVG